MQEYLDLHTRNRPILAVRYADLAARPKQSLQQVFEYCDLLPAWHEGVLKVFDSDAQAGTALRRFNPKEGNKVRFTPEQLDRIRVIIRRHPVLNRTDVVVPGI